LNTCNEKDLLPFICARNELDESYIQRDSLPSERKTNRYFISKTTSTDDHARRTSVRFINIVIGAQKFVCHTQKSYVFLLRQQTTPPTEGNLSLPLLPSLASSPTPCSTTTTTLPLFYIGRPSFLSLFLLVFLTRCPALRCLFSSLPTAGASYHPTPVSCSALFRAVEIVCPYGGRAAIRRGRSNEKGGVNGISRGRHGHRRQR